MATLEDDGSFSDHAELSADAYSVTMDFDNDLDSDDEIFTFYKDRHQKKKEKENQNNEGNDTNEVVADAEPLRGDRDGLSDLEDEIDIVDGIQDDGELSAYSESKCGDLDVAFEGDIESDDEIIMGSKKKKSLSHSKSKTSRTDDNGNDTQTNDDLCNDNKETNNNNTTDTLHQSDEKIHDTTKMVSGDKEPVGGEINTDKPHSSELHDKKKKNICGEENDDDEEETEMTEEEKEDMYNAIRNGEYVLFQDLLDKKNADINMLWYKENLLMVALRAKQTVMAEFLIDNGIDYNYETTILELKDKEKTGKRLYQYKLSCRQLAYNLGMLDIVEIIDVKNNNIHKYYKVSPRIPRMRRPRAPTPPWLKVEEEEEDELLENEDDLDSGQSNVDIVNVNVNENHNELTEENIAELDITDDGYESISRRSSSSVHQRHELIEERPGLLRRGTKSSMALRQYNDMKYKHKMICKSAKESKNMASLESYSRENQSWQTGKSREDNISVESVPFIARMSSVTSSKRTECGRAQKKRPFSSPAAFSPLTEIQKILGQNRLLSSKLEPALPYIKPPYNGIRTNSSKVTCVTPWCHGNSSSVFERLSNTRIKNDIYRSKLIVNQQLFQRTRRR